MTFEHRFSPISTNGGIKSSQAGFLDNVRMEHLARKPYQLLKALLWKGFVMFSVLISLGAVFFPSPARAGFVSTLSRLLSTLNNATESMAGLLSVFPPLLGAQASGALIDQESSGMPVEAQLEPEYDDMFMVSQHSALIAPRNPAGTFADPEHGVIAVYTVKPGDVPSLIAERFGVSLNTILWANDIKNPNLIKAGDQLVVLPVSGVQYEVKKGDTLESIARRFKPRDDTTDVQGMVADIVSFNGLAINQALEIGSTIIIPDGEIASALSVLAPSRTQSKAQPSKAAQSRSVQFTEDAKGYFVRPVVGGIRTRGIHGMNGIDLADSCGTPVRAAAEGTVILAKSTGWNGGYGQYVIVTHPNGTQTLYGHLSGIYVSVGQKIAQGVQVGDIGSTGNSTGCHLHFEVRGAKNPF